MTTDTAKTERASVRAMPPDGGLVEPKRKFEDTFSVDDILRREFEEQLFAAQLVADGIAIRAHGMIYRLPLCHDFGNENI